MTSGAWRRMTDQPTIRRLLLILGAGVVVWGVLALVRAVRQDALDGVGVALTPADTGAVDTVVIEGRTDAMRLVRGPGGTWTANGFAADTARIRELLRALIDTTIWSEQVAASPSSHDRLGVSADSGRRVRVMTGAKTPFDFVVGKRTAGYNGVFVRQPDADAVYAIHASELAHVLTRTAEDWRDKRISAVVSDSVETIALRRGRRTIMVRRAGTAWTVDGAAADSAAVASLLETFRDLTATGFATGADADPATLANPRFAVAIRSRSGAPLLDLAVDSTASGVFARADTGRTVYRLDPWQMSRILPADSSLRRRVTR